MLFPVRMMLRLINRVNRIPLNFGLSASVLWSWYSRAAVIAASSLAM